MLCGSDCLIMPSVVWLWLSHYAECSVAVTLITLSGVAVTVPLCCVAVSQIGHYDVMSCVPLEMLLE